LRNHNKPELKVPLFSGRNAPQSERYDYRISERVRSRILHTLQQLDPGGHASFGHYSFGSLLEQVGQGILANQGAMRHSGYEAARMSPHPVIDHFFQCPDNEAVDFIELCFRTRGMLVDVISQAATASINGIFEQEGVGYEVIPTVWRDTGKPAKVFGELTGSNEVTAEYARVVRKGDRSVHAVAVKPALESLADPRFAVASSELLKAFDHMRRSEFPAAVTSAGSAFESVMRTICDGKGWHYDPNRDACGDLVKRCQDGGLIPSFYVESMKAVGTLRNKMGSVHGRGPAPAFDTKKEHAENMIAVTCAHIDLLIRLAG
jgi:hypothetical protein